MSKYTVEFSQHFTSKTAQIGVVGTIKVEAESAERAREIVEDIDLCVTLGTCDPAGVDIESVKQENDKIEPLVKRGGSFDPHYPREDDENDHLQD